MRNAPSGPRFLIVCIIATILSAGCAGVSRQPSDTGESPAVAAASRVLAALALQNEKLATFKGIGKIEVRRNEKNILDERIAWVGSEPNRLSIAVLISGHPALKIASDGTWFYYYEIRPGAPIYKKEPATEATLQRIVAMPIKISDILRLLAGRTPLRAHHTAVLDGEDSDNGYVLILKKWWGDVVEKVYLDEDRSQVRQVEFFDRRGALEYRARFDDMQVVGGYRVPAGLSITNGEGIAFRLEVERFLPNVPVSPAMFVLKPPE